MIVLKVLTSFDARSCLANAQDDKLCLITGCGKFGTRKSFEKNPIWFFVPPHSQALGNHQEKHAGWLQEG